MANKSQKQMLFDSIVNSQIDDAYKAKVEANYNAWAQQQASMPQIDNDYQAKVDADYNAWANSQKKATTASVQPKQIQSASMPAIMNRVEPTMENLKLASERQGVWQNDYNPITVHQDKPKSDFAGTSFENGILKMYGKQPTVTQENIDELNKFKQIPNLKDYLTAINEQTSGNNIADIQQTVANVAQAEKWLDPEYKLSKKEEKQAKELANAELAKLKGHALTEDEKLRKQTYEDLKSKTSNLRSFGINARDALYKFGKGMTDLAIRIGTAKAQAHERERNAMRAAIGQAPVLSTEDINAMSGAAKQFENDVANWEKESGYRDLVRNTKTQNPIASGAGNFAGNAAVYGLTGGAAGALGETLGIGGTVGGYLANQGIQASQDLVSDIWPTVIEMKEDGELTPEEYKALEQQFSADVIGNVFMDVAGNAVSKLARNAISKVAAKRAAQAAEQAAFTQNIKQGADYLEYLNKTGATGLEPKATDIPQIDSTTASNNDFRTLMDEFNHTFKDDSAMKNIFTPEDLEAAQKAQFDELMKDRPKTINDLAPEDIPEINNIKPSLLDEIDAMNGEMENMFTTPKEAKTEPILPQIEPIANKVETPEIKSKQPKLDPDVEANVIYELGQMGDVYYGKRGTIENTDFRIPNATINEIDNNGKKAYQIFNGNSEKPIVDRKFKTLEEAEQAKADYIAGDKLKEKALKAYDDIGNAIHRYEKALFDTDDVETVTAAKRAVDAARKRYERAMKELDPGFKSELTSQKYGEQVGKPLYRRFPELEKVMTPEQEKATQEFVDSLIADENALHPNRWVRDAEPDNVIPFRGVNENVKKEGFTNPDSQKILDAYRNGDRLSQYEQDVLEMALLEDKYDNLRKYSDDIVTVEKSDIPDDVLKEMIGENYDNQLDSVKLSAELAKRGFNIWENGYNNNIMANYPTMLDAVAHHLAADNIPAEIMAEAYDITYKNGGTLDDAIKLAADMAGTKLSNPTYGEGVKLSAKNVVEDTANKPKKIFEIKELHDKKGKSRYQVVERVGENMTQPVEGRKTYKSMDEANEAIYNLQYFANNGNESGIDPALKVSDTYNNTGKRGGGWTADEVDKHTKAHNFLYETIDEQRSVEEATRMRAEEGREAFKNRVLYEDRISSIELDGLMMEWRELTEEARSLEAQGKRADMKWQEANKIFRKVQEQSTDNAQALQALAKWSRNTPEGMLTEAENIINGKVDAPTSEMQKALDKFSKSHKKPVEFSADFVRDFLNEAEKINGLKGTELDSREAREVMAKLGKMVNDQIPVKLPEKLQTFLMDNMLGNFRTLISRNAGGNVGLNAMEQTVERPLAAGIDKLVSLKTGKRTQAGLSIEGLSDYFSGFKKGLADEMSDVKTGLHTARSGENTLGNAITSNRRIFKSKLLNLNDQLVRHGLSVGDRPFYESVYKQTLGDYQRLYDKGLMGEQVQSLKPEEFKQYAEVAANLNALGAVYQQNSQLSNGLLGLKRGVGQISDGILGFDILSQFSMPFVKTPANVVERAIDYSPLGFVRNTARTAKELNNGTFDQNRFANETARNIIGTGLMTGGAVLSANGGLTDAYSDDKDKKQAQKESGMQEYAWNVPEAIPGIGGKQMDISWVPVLGSNLVAAAAAENAYKNGGEDLGLNLYKGAMAGGQALFDQSMFQGLQRLFGTGDSFNSDQGIVENMGNTVKSGLGQFIPSLARQGAQVIDPYQRDLAYSNKGESFGPMDNYDINSLANNIPFLRQDYLAPKVDTEGNLMKENQGRNVGMKMLEDMILPGKLTEYNENSLTKESNRLTDVTGNNTSYLPKADRSKVDPENNMSNDAWVDYQQKYYKQMNGAASSLIASDYYKGLSDVDKEQALANLYKDVKSVVNAEYTGKDISSGGKVFKEQGIDGLIKSYEAKAINKQYGLSSSSSVAEDIQKAVNSGDTQKAEQIAQTLADFKDYGSDNATNAYKRYEKTKSYIPGLTVSEYKKTLNEIDGLGDQGKVNGQISQKEMLAYLNQNNISDEDAQKLFKQYGNDWKGTLKRKKDGTWTVSNK